MTPDLKAETMTKTSLEEQEHLWEDTNRGELTTVSRWQMQGSAQGQSRSQRFPCTERSILHLLPWGLVGHRKSSQQGWTRSSRIRGAKSREDFRKMVQRVRELILEVPWK